MRNHPNRFHLLLLSLSLLIAASIVGLIFHRYHVKSQPVSSIKVDRTEEEPATFARMVILPHHELILRQISQRYESLFSTSTPAQPSTVILISPNHYFWERKLPVVHSMPNQHENEIENTPLFISQASDFEQEHGILLHLPFVRKHFPSAKLFPILLTRNISKDDLDRLVEHIKVQHDIQQTLVIGSIDFSHYLPRHQTLIRDQHTISLIKENNAKAVLSLSDEYTDCPACLYVMLKLADEWDLDKPQLLFHDNSASYLPQSESEPTTSYFVLKWSK